MDDDAKVGELLAKCYISLSDAWTYATELERRADDDDALKYRGLRRDINTVMELSGRLVKELRDGTN